MSEQIAFASTEHEKYMTSELKSKLVRMKKELEMRESKVIELQRHKGGEFDENNFEFRIVEVADPNLQNMKLKDNV